MCGRYAASKSADQLVEEFEVETPPAELLAADFNVAPTKQVYAVLERVDDKGTAHRRLSVARWGLVPSWAKDPSVGSRMANARLETAAQKPSFRAAWAKRRCIIPADGYYEWQMPVRADAPKGAGGKPIKQPWFIHPRDGGSLAMAGLYEFWRDRTRADDDPAAWLWTVTVLTTEASDSLGRIHDRAPLVVLPDERAAWLDPHQPDPSDVVARLRPATEGLLEAYPVSTSVNSVRNNGPQLLEPVPLPEAFIGE